MSEIACPRCDFAYAEVDGSLRCPQCGQEIAVRLANGERPSAAQLHSLMALALSKPAGREPLNDDNGHRFGLHFQN
jgi:uncharacterized Zn finger protein (UPF0148 family)